MLRYLYSKVRVHDVWCLDSCPCLRCRLVKRVFRHHSRSAVTFNKIRKNTKRFQILLLSNQEHDFSAAIQLARECKWQLDNSRLYVVSAYSTVDSADTMFEAWARIHRKIPDSVVNDITSKRLFLTLLKTNAHKAANLNEKNVFETAFSYGVIALFSLKCLLNCPSVFPLNSNPSALELISRLSPGGGKDNVAISLMLKAIQLTSCHPQAELLLNRLDQRQTNALCNFISQCNFGCLKVLLDWVPLLDLDYFAWPSPDCKACSDADNDDGGACQTHARWYSAEQLNARRNVRNVAARARLENMIEEARKNLENIRRCRAAEVVGALFESRVMPLDICGLINSFNQRPDCHEGTP